MISLVIRASLEAIAALRDPFGTTNRSPFHYFKTSLEIIRFAVMLCILFLLFGHPGLIGFLKGWAPQALVDLVASFGFLTHFEGLSKGVIEVPALVFFASLTAVCLWISRMLIERLQAS